MPEKNNITQEMIIKAFVEEDMINAAFVRDLLQNAIIIPKPGKEQLVEKATTNLRAIYKSAIKMHGEEQVNKAQQEDIAGFESS